MKRAIIIMVMLFPCISSFGKTVSVEDAQTVGYHFLQHNGAAGLENAGSLQLMCTVGDGQPCYYIFNAPHGFVIVSAEDAVAPVLGYSNEIPFTTYSVRDNIAWLLGHYKRQITDVTTNHIEATPSVTQQWQALKNSRTYAAQRTTGTPVVGPLLATTWNQDPGYNDLCPTDAHATCCGGHAPTGCVATAMAQIMYYWKWPDYPTGSNSYTSTNYGTLSATFSGVTYNWASMPVSSSNTNIETLMFDAGVAVDMDYGPTSSSAALCGSTSSAAYALANYFCYSSSIQGIQRAAFTDSNWVSIIETELRQPRPVIYSGDDGAGTEGHAWVVDGFDVNNFFHCNWGWGGSDNGYFYMNNMVPAPVANGNYDSTQWVLTGITPSIQEYVSMDSTDVCIGRIQTYISGGTGGAWSTSNAGVATVTATGVVTGIAPGTATISYTASNSCGTRSSTGKVRVLSAASSVNCDSLSAVASVQSADNTFEIYPNPGNGEFTIELPENGDATIIVTNLPGREVAKQTSQAQKTELSLRGVSPGMYIVEVSMGNAIYRKMVVVR